MENGTFPSHFYLTVFKDMGYLKYFFFILTFAVYFAIIFFNIIIVMIISMERVLHEPMYIFICCLSINSLYGTLAFFPRLMIDLLSDIHTISRPACFTQIFIIYTYASCEFTILTMMAYDRYAAICVPLQYNSIMTSKMITAMMGIAWIYPMFCLSLVIYFSIRLPLCGNEIERVFCANWSVVRLSCVGTELNNIVGFFITTTTVFLPLAFVLFSYIKILTVCQKSSKEFRKKAFQTCLPHLVTFINYSITMFCEITMTRFEGQKGLHVIAIILSLEFLIIPPILNPLIYGLNLPEIRKRILLLFKKKKIDLAP
ncbi:putative gustatory receptor clone PTE03 [Megalops cyprinoides]|uniref:putative gustatory receptor clone PTE03 n=1 Tax=Megalops cyprinoides TaxID=118141 RepID=UPI0018653A9D|nr:putative gustatory receptor clone PTE03 [Megalops cyprinoides]